MKKVFLYAYDKQNLGDDLFVHTITKRYPHVKFYIWTDKKNRETFRCLRNLKVVDRDSRWVKFLSWLRPSLVPRYRGWLENRCKAVVYIGGSIFMEYENWAQILTWWEYEAENRPFYALGCNFGPWHTEAYREKISQIYAKMKDVCFRDEYSYRLFQDVETVRRAPDILFSYPMPKVPVKEKQIFVSIIDCAGRDESHGLAEHDQHYVQNMADMLKKYLSKGYRLVLSSFCTHEGDVKGIEKILDCMGCRGDSGIRILAYDGTNADEMTHAISESEYVIATRFHAVILAMAAGRPVLPVIYSDKTLHVLEDLGFDGDVIDIRSDKSYADHALTTGFDVDMQELSSQAQKHFEKLDHVLLK